MTNKQSPEIETMLWTIQDVISCLNISRAEFYRLNQSGKFAPLPVGLCRKVLYQKQEVLDWISTKCPHRKIWQTMKGSKT